MTPEETEKQEAWRKGYDLGTKNTLRENAEAIKLGQAILDVLDNRYESAERGY